MPTLPPLRLCAALCALCLLLCACWLPEHYVARIRIERDGSYTLYAEGTAAHRETLLARLPAPAGAKGGQQKRQDEARAAMQKELAALAGDKRVMNASAIENGRMRFSLSGSWRLDPSLLIFSEQQTPVAYAVGQDGTYRLRVKDAAPTAESRALGVKTEGALSVVLAQGIEVLEHNAQATPSGPGGAYRWQITEATGEAPYLKIRLPAPGSPPPAAPPAPKAGNVPSRDVRIQKGLARP